MISYAIIIQFERYFHMKQIEPDIEEEKQSFISLGLREVLLNNLSTLGYKTMTPIQSQSLPIMLEHHDVIAQAKTGSGKTAAFGLSLLNRLNIDKYAVQALILCPTRELAEQVSQSLRQLARLMPNVKVLNLSGGMPLKPQLNSLRHKAHIIVGTPGRVQKHLDKESLSLHTVETLVLDEADRMLDMGFLDAIREIIKKCPRQRQTLLFSATFPTEIKKLTGEFMQNPKKVVVKDAHTELDIEQIFYEVESSKEKLNLLKALLLHHKPAAALIFCNTKEKTSQVAEMLSKEGFSVVALNGDMEQVDRDIAIIRFKNKSCSIMVATDVAARGLDIEELPIVINFELAFEHDVHIHRIGRTGRAGSKGLALSLIGPADLQRICIIEDGLQHSINKGNSRLLTNTDSSISLPEMITICIYAGKKDKIRPGDILGALTKDAGLPGNIIGKIDITLFYSYVAVHRNYAERALNYMKNGKLKGCKVTAKKVE
jgi:ATP-dependent RNA helicase DbpA